MTDRTSLGDRMKRYEQAARTVLPQRMPVILRVDGKAFHTFTRGFDRPFDMRLMGAMDTVALTLCEDAQGAQLAYVQSDEISVLLHNYKRLNSESWFDNQVQKIVSVAAATAASMMTMEYQKLVAFDARVFVLPEAEVVNYFIWRQQDATRNSIQMAARAVFSHKQLDHKSGPELQDMLHAKGINWNDYPVGCRRGRCVVRSAERQWSIQEPPIFTADREYIQRHLAVEPELSAAEKAA